MDTHLQSYQIRYVRHPFTQNYHVTLVGYPRQNAVIQPAAFIRATGVHPRAVLGAAQIDWAAAAAFGFTVTEGAAAV
ncbi:hypothetical protein [Paenibacillus ehimensis]|uniref:Uncharacterized protein n=1 Tax=Paenibacillus ehimensis TaxID=79264 RepID=A0ABT8VMJ4_9BACL|nr:hypothetical protein [Paenibacillus ehimensis]MDO3682213.1 hypothetical protein [Paenibacillus ehimensis]